MNDLNDKIRDHYKAELKRAKAEMNAAMTECQRLWAEHEKVRGPVEKKKSGRPSVWKGLVGAYLVNAVEEIIIRKLKGEERGEEEGWVDLDDPEDYRFVEIAETAHAHSPKGGGRLYTSRRPSGRR